MQKHSSKYGKWRYSLIRPFCNISLCKFSMIKAVSIFPVTEYTGNYVGINTHSISIFFSSVSLMSWKLNIGLFFLSWLKNHFWTISELFLVRETRCSNTCEFGWYHVDWGGGNWSHSPLVSSHPYSVLWNCPLSLRKKEVISAAFLRDSQMSSFNSVDQVLLQLP